MKRTLATFLLFALGLQAFTSAAPDPLEALALAKKDRPWFGRFMSGDPVVAGFPGESDEDRVNRMQKWKDAKLGLFLHWGPQRAGGEYIIKPAVLDKFNPVKFDAEEWVLSAKKIGFRYIVITAKHHAGFCMFDSKHTDHDIMDATPFGRDPLKELADACKKHDMLLGFYYSVWDIKHPDYTAKIGSPNYANYHQFMLDQTEEILTKYGDVVTLWMDGEWVNSWTYERATEYRDAARKQQPNIALVDRIGQRRLGDGDYASCENFTPYVGDNINGRFWESCQRFDGGWFWQGKDTSKSAQWALSNLVDTVSRGGNLLLNMGPSPKGDLPPNSVAKLQPLGVWLRQYGESIYGVERGPHYLLDWGTCTRRDNTLYYHVAHWPNDGTLRIPGLNAGQPNANIREVVLMGKAPMPLEFKQDGADVLVSVPEKSVNPLMSVIKVELKSAPVVDNAIRPLTRGLRPQKGNAQVKVGDYFLSAGFAKIHGNDLHFSLGAGAGGQRENLKGWTNVEDWAEWEIRAEEPGTYDVLVNHSSWMKGGKFVLEIAGKSFEHEVVVTGVNKGRKSPFAAAFKRASLGQITLDQPGTYKVTIKALSIEPKAIEYDRGLMMMREVILSKKK